MMKPFPIAAALLASLAALSPAHAQDRPKGPVLALKAGTAGFGAEVTYGLSHIVRVRAGGYGFPLSVSASTDDVDYDLDLRLLSGAGYLDIHPFGGRFRLSAGLVYNANRLDAVGELNNGLDIDGVTFTAEEVGRLEGDITFRRWSPYAGIGWGSPLARGSHWAFEADLGVIYQERPMVDLRSVGGTLSGDPVLMDAVEEEEQDLQDDIDFFRFYPVVSVGLSYTF